MNNTIIIPEAPSRFGRLRIRMWGWVFIALAPIIGLSACATETHEEIKTIDGHSFLCTWTQEPGSPFTKKDYRCEAFQG